MNKKNEKISESQFANDFKNTFEEMSEKVDYKINMTAIIK